MKRLRSFFREVAIVLRTLLKKVLASIFWLVDQVLGSIPSLIRAKLILVKRAAEKQRAGISSSDPRLKIPEEDLKAELESDIKRLEGIEDKAKSTVLGVTLSVSLASPAILLLVQQDVFADETLTLRVTSAIILVAAITFLFVSGYLSLSGYQVGQVSRPGLENHESLVTPDDARKVILYSIDLNVLRVIQKANLLSASMDCLRNGLVLILVFLLLAALSALF
jgi:hypothetical protein